MAARHRVHTLVVGSVVVVVVDVVVVAVVLGLLFDGAGVSRGQRLNTNIA